MNIKKLRDMTKNTTNKDTMTKDTITKITMTKNTMTTHIKDKTFRDKRLTIKTFIIIQKLIPRGHSLKIKTISEISNLISTMLRK